MIRTELHSGVYTITNTVNGRVYVGSAGRSFKSRWQKHASDLKLNKHDNCKLQRAYNKYGKDAFRFGIIAICPPEYALKLEQFFIQNINPYYNICMVAGSSLGVKRTEEYKRKLSESRRGFKTSAEFKEKCRQRMLGNSITKGKKQSPEVIQRKAAAQTGTKRSTEARKNMSLKAKERGRKQTDQCKKKISDARKKYLFTIENIAKKEVFKTDNLKAFCIEKGLHDGHLNTTHTGVTTYGKSSLQHKGFRIIEKTLLK